ncbi:MAG: hypothetical protein SOV85_01875 [Clostridium sp.]|uniref:hypothetical protein n=1 Tax=Clostridium sp. TaxID=1506 RepID=UPI002A749842|nr:hypothetical protein [Clostridium sp.]MDY2630092.1 hypothetical protein [Clostridium sp.]
MSLYNRNKKIKNKFITKGKHVDIMESIVAKNVPSSWTYNLDYTFYQLIVAVLEKYLHEADKIIVIHNKEDILWIIEETKKLLKDFDDVVTVEQGEDVQNRTISVFNKLSEILPTLWW